VTVADAVRAVDFVLPALEIVDSRIRDWKISIIDTISDNASSGGVVLGSRAVSLREVDLRLMGCTLHSNGELAAKEHTA
jgi:2-keto-4-pentenoate hydratase